MNIKTSGHKTTPHQRELAAKYNRDTGYEKLHMKKLMLSFHKENEAFLLDWLAKQPNKSGYIKRLIIADMAKQKREESE